MGWGGITSAGQLVSAAQVKTAAVARTATVNWRAEGFAIVISSV
jgi:hypothetical protein